ncbi:unnamed protein product, partial [Discosporangium mesarthrocarpum]
RGAQRVEGYNPVDHLAKVPLEITSGGFRPLWGGVRRGRTRGIVHLRGTTGLQHTMLRLLQGKAHGSNVFQVAQGHGGRARVVFRWEGWTRHRVTLHADFDYFKGEAMGEDQRAEQLAHEAIHFLPPGVYKYYFMVEGKRRVDESLPTMDGEGGRFNLVSVTNRHLGLKGEQALLNGHECPGVHMQGLWCLGLGPGQEAHGGKEKDGGGGGDTHVDSGTAEGSGRLQQQDRCSSVVPPNPATTLPGFNNSEEEEEEEEGEAGLVSVDLSRHQICDDGAAALALALTGNGSVRHLYLSLNRISSEGGAAIASVLGSGAPPVVTLSLAQNGLGRRGGEHLGRALLGGWTAVETLNLADNHLGDDGTEALCAGLEGHPCLATLVLDRNSVSLDGTAALVSALLTNRSVTHLSMRGNSLLADSAARLSDLLSRNRNLSSLDLSHNPLGPDGAERLAPCLHRGSKRMTTELTDTGGAGGGTGLVFLGLQGCGIQKPSKVKNGLYYLARGIEANRSLRTLDLSANGVDEYGVQELAHALLKNSMIKEINLTGNPIPAEWLREHHEVCSEVYDRLPSLGESLRRHR